MPPRATRDGIGGRRCTRCQTFKNEEREFCWQDGAHRYRDTACKECRARLKRERTIPKHTVRRFVFPYGLTDRMHDHLDDVTLAYVAGLVDGEGYIGSSQPRSNHRPLVIRITMIHRPTVEWMHSVCGGQFCPHRSKQGNARQAYTWHLCGARSYSLLRRLAPFMRTKREEAEVALAIGATLWSENVRGRVTQEILEQRAELGQRLRDLKRIEWVA